MGRWSEESAVIVSQVVCWRCAGRLSMRVMSGDECCWFAAVGRRVGESVLIVEKFVVLSRSDMRSPLWSVSVENQVGECAFASARMMVVLMFLLWSKKVVISVSMSCVLMWVSLGGM